MRVIVVTQDDPFYVPLFFESFLPALEDRIEVIFIACLDPFDESLVDLMVRMYRLYGPVDFVRRGVEYVVRSASSWAGKGRYSVRNVAARHGVPVEDVNSVNSNAFVNRVEAEGVDVILSVSAPQIFGTELLEAPAWGCLNVHTAELPKYRGMLPTFWALYHGEDHVGVTVHTMDETIDAGQIAAQTTFPVRDDDSLDDVIKRGKREGGALAASALNDLAGGDLSLSPMQGEGAYYSFPTVAERREFQRRGRDLL